MASVASRHIGQHISPAAAAQAGPGSLQEPLLLLGGSEMGSCSFLPTSLPFLGKIFLWPYCFLLSWN